MQSPRRSFIGSGGRTVRRGEAADRSAKVRTDSPGFRQGPASSSVAPQAKPAHTSRPSRKPTAASATRPSCGPTARRRQTERKIPRHPAGTSVLPFGKDIPAIRQDSSSGITPACRAKRRDRKESGPKKRLNGSLRPGPRTTDDAPEGPSPAAPAPYSAYRPCRPARNKRRTGPKESGTRSGCPPSSPPSN